MPTVAVIIPMYNRATLIRRAIDSVLQQSFADFELIVVDDGSTDGSAEIVGSIADSRLRLLRQPRNLGANAARNRGIAESSAPLIAFLDSDDEYLPDKLRVVVGMFEQQADLGALLDSYVLFDPAEHDGLPQNRINPVVETSEEFLALMLDTSNRGRRMRKSTSGISLRREVALRAGLFDETLERRQDMEFLARLAKVARCATTDRQLWLKHETPDAISNKSHTFIASTLVVCRRNPEYLSDRAMRRGLSRDIVRHFRRSARAGKWGEILRDLRALTAELGPLHMLRLLASSLSLLGGQRAA